MGTSILQQLDNAEITRAHAIALFSDPDRLARRPRCGKTKDFSQIRSASHALTHPYIQPNSPVAYARLVFDLDWHQPSHPFHKMPVRYLAAENAWENELSLPAPSWVAISPEKNSAHIGYELSTPVGRHAHARAHPLNYLAAIETAMGEKLKADAGFSGVLCKNPLNAAWDFYGGHKHGRELGELAEWVTLPERKLGRLNRTPCGEVGRNVFLFDKVRFWAYDHRKDFGSLRYEIWEQAVIASAIAINAENYDHLPFLAGRGLLPMAECKHVGKSVARWTWLHHGTRRLTAAFSKLQSQRGAKGAAASAAMKRERREEQILSAIAQLTASGELATMGKVAKLIGCSKATLSENYKRFFQGTLQ